ncbi:hypothetical protein [Arenimonas sp.]|uniref:WD40/YVTN/BNR-like repeat-containing protein n=1 Tax=Arenimonas sp. TaxID=1872635 RepID=UPI002D1FBC7D|nr:hypothetical protein [Arenimonas sp.]
MTAQDVSSVADKDAPRVEVPNDAPRIEALTSPVTVRLRGLSAVDENIAWASGREGTVIRTIDAGKTWSVFKVPGAEKLDFRDVEGFSADEAVILSIGPGEDSRVYRTSDGGRSWVLALQNTNPNAFFDCFSFDGREGRLLGDPIDGRFEVLRTADAGKTWIAMDGPVAADGEAAFAASGTCILHRGAVTVVASGGSAARAHWLVEGKNGAATPPEAWTATGKSEFPAAPSAGYFSVAAGLLGMVMAGGDYTHEQTAGIAQRLGAGHLDYAINAKGSTPAHWSRSGNEAILAPEKKKQALASAVFLHPEQMPAPRAYRSGVACSIDKPLCVSAGPSGADTWDGNSWKPLQGEGYDSVASAGRVFWFSGDGGRLGRLLLP